MKYCFKCGAAMDDEAQFCPSCGTPGVNIREAAPAPIPTPQPAVPKKGKQKLAWAAVIAVFLIVAIVVSCSFGLFDGLFYGSSTSMRDDDDDDDDRGTRPTVSTDPTDPTDSTNPPAEPVTIKVWAPSEDLADGNSWLETMQERFELLHPEWSIHWENTAVGEGDVGSIVRADVTASADVYLFSSDQTTSLVNVGGLTKLGGKYLEQVLNDNPQVLIDSVTHTDGEQYGFPLANNTCFLYYDKSVFTEEDVKSLDTMLTKGKVHLPLKTPGTAAAPSSWAAAAPFLARTALTRTPASTLAARRATGPQRKWWSWPAIPMYSWEILISQK